MTVQRNSRTSVIQRMRDIAARAARTAAETAQSGSAARQPNAPRRTPAPGRPAETPARRPADAQTVRGSRRRGAQTNPAMAARLFGQGVAVSGTAQLRTSGTVESRSSVASPLDLAGRALGQIRDGVADTLDQVVPESVQNAARDVGQRFAEVHNQVGDALRDTLGGATGVDRQIAGLNSPGDTFRMGLGGQAAAGVQVGGRAEMEVARTDEGYTVTVSGEASAGVFGRLGVRTGVLDAGVSGEINATGRVSVEATYATRAEAQAAARTIAGMTMGGALGPAGTLLTGSTAGDEMRDFQEHVTATRVRREISGEVAAELGVQVGHAGLGGSAGVEAQMSMEIEMRPGQDPTMIIGSSITGRANISLGTGELDLPGGGELDLAEAGGEGTLRVESRIPLEGISPAAAVADPSAVLAANPSLMRGAQHTIGADVVVQGGGMVLTPGLGAPGAQHRGGALNASIAATVSQQDLQRATARIFDGDLRGALRGLSEGSQIDVNLEAVDRRGQDIDVDIQGAVFRFGVEAEYMTRDVHPVYRFQGSAADLGRDASDFFDRLTDIGG